MCMDERDRPAPVLMNVSLPCALASVRVGRVAAAAAAEDVVLPPPPPPPPGTAAHTTRPAICHLTKICARD